MRISAAEFDRRLQESLKGRRERPRREREKDKREHWQAWATQPLPHLALTLGKHGEGVCTLEQDGQIIGTWCDADLPWLHTWLSAWLPVLHGAWHMAQPQARSRKGAKLGGDKTGPKTRDAAKKRADYIAAEEKKQLAVASNLPVEELARRITRNAPRLGSQSTIRKKLTPRKKRQK